jgi:hypothetical protein
LEQAQLETWSGATGSSAAMQNTNRYLLSSLGPAERLELRTAKRTWIVLCASGAALAIGLLLIYVPALRRSGVLFSGGLVLLAASVIYPEPTLLVAQAATLGLALTLLAGLLKRLLSRSGRRGVVISGSSSYVAGSRHSTDAYYRPQTSSSSATTTVALQPSESSG